MSSRVKHALHSPVSTKTISKSDRSPMKLSQVPMDSALLKDPAAAVRILTSGIAQSIKDLRSQMKPCINPWCSRFSHRKDKLCPLCQEITSGVFVENMLIHLSWHPSTWRLRVGLSAAELMWSPSGSWEMQALPGSPFPVVVKAVSVTSFALGGRLICRLPPGTYCVFWRLSRAPMESELDVANQAQAIWGLRYDKSNCFRWNNPTLESRMRCSTETERGPIQVRGMCIDGDTVGMLPNWSEMAVGTINLTGASADDNLCALTLEVELHGGSAQDQGGLYIDGVVVSQVKDTDKRKLFNDATRVIREAKVGSAV